MKVYVSGRMAGLEDHGFPAFMEAEERLVAAGYADVVNPAKLTLQEYGSVEEAGKAAWSTHLRRDIAALMKCDVIVTLPGWEESRGANLEVMVARAVDIRVTTLEELIAVSRHEEDESWDH